MTTPLPSTSAITRRLVIVLLLSTCAGPSLSQTVPNSPSEPKFSELSPQDRNRLDQQRALIATVIKQRYGMSLARTKKDLPALQRLLDDKVFKKSQTYELQSLGVVFGDVLASEFPLRWAMVTDEYGTDPTLRLKQTTVSINALTMISKRVEHDEAIDFSLLLRQTGEAISEAKKKML